MSFLFDPSAPEAVAQAVLEPGGVGQAEGAVGGASFCNARI